MLVEALERIGLHQDRIHFVSSLLNPFWGRALSDLMARTCGRDVGGRGEAFKIGIIDENYTDIRKFCHTLLSRGECMLLVILMHGEKHRA